MSRATSQSTVAPLRDRRARPAFIAAASLACLLASLAEVGAGTPAALSLRPAVFEPTADPGAWQLRGAEHAVHLRADEWRVALEVGTTAAGERPSDLAIRLDGADPSAPGSLEGEALGRVHYLLGREPAAWRSGVPRGKRLRFAAAWPGIDVLHHLKDRRLEVDFVVAPGADADVIRLEVGGGVHPLVEPDGSLCLQAGEAALRWDPPVAYQVEDSGRSLVECAHVVRPDGSVGFELGSHDPDRELVIDPVLTYSSYFGGTLSDHLTAVARDSDGTLVVAGKTHSPGLAAGSAPWQPELSDGRDAFVARLSPTADEILWLTYLGGSGSDVILDLQIAADGVIHFVGNTTSADFPLVAPFQASLDDSNGNGNAVLGRLSADGSTLELSSYLGAGGEGAWALALAEDGADVFVGPGVLEGFPGVDALLEPAPDALNGFLARVSASGEVEFATALPHFWDPLDVGLLSDGSIIVVGSTRSRDLPVVGPTGWGSPEDCDEPTCDQDLVLMKWSPDGQQLLRSTRFGGSRNDGGAQLHVDPADRVHVAASSASDDFPLRDPFRTWFAPVALLDGLVLTFDPDLETQLFGSFVGNCIPAGVLLDELGATYLAGATPSGAAGGGDFEPVDPGTANRPGEGNDVCVVKLPPERNGVEWSVQIGGSLNAAGELFPPADIALGLAFAESGLAVVGETACSDFPLESPLRDAAVNEGSGVAFEGFILLLEQDPPASAFEPSALDLRPWVQALTVHRPSGSAASVAVGWEESMGGGGRYTLLRGTISSLRRDRAYDHAPVDPCGITEAEIVVDVPEEDSYFLVVAEKSDGSEVSSRGRDSLRRERPEPAAPCP